MSGAVRTPLRALVMLFWTAVVVAPFISHFAIVSGRFMAVAAGFALVQALAIGIIGWRARGVMRATALALATFMLVTAAMRLLDPTSATTVLLTTSGVSHALLYCSLLLLFGQTLQPGRRPLVTVMATRIQGPLNPAMTRYTRGVTVYWCCFFGAQLMISAILLAWAPHAMWSLFVNVLDDPLVLFMFAAEYAFRHLRFRNMPHVSPIAIMRSFSRDRATIEHG